MPEPTTIPAPIPTTTNPPPACSPQHATSSDAVVCERCGAEMFRMHAVWHCANCRYKTDCCGW